jgi:TRAP-type C4-dicarboxylate transport system permease small subunit
MDWRAFIARACGWLAAVFLAGMMLLTVADVVLRAVSNTPIRGVVELVELMLACTFFFALPAVFLRDENIVVDVIDGWRPRLVPVLKKVASVGAFVMLAVIAWQSRIAAKDSLEFGDVTSDLSLPKILYWIPVLAGIAGGALAAAAMAFKRDERE